PPRSTRSRSTSPCTTSAAASRRTPSTSPATRAASPSASPRRSTPSPCGCRPGRRASTHAPRPGSSPPRRRGRPAPRSSAAAAPLGIEVARAAGSTVWDASGRAYLDLLAGMGVANVGHTHPEVVAAVRAQAERHLHVMVYGEFVQEAQVRLATRLAGLLAPPL